MKDFKNLGEDPNVARRRIMAQGVNILRSIVDAYNDGSIEDQNSNTRLCSLFALIAEGKVISYFDTESGSIKWSLTDDYLKRLKEVEDAILESKILAGPWGQE